ncbi:MAG: TonB-dependent receptor plug domain-containing protein [Gammaproteobacteria bacterium]
MFRTLFILSAVFSITPATAVSAENRNDLETLIVTASRTPLPASQIGSSFTVIRDEQLRDRQVAPVSEVLRDVPGFAVSRSGVLGSATQIRVRGAEANQVLVLIDGVEANDPAQGGEFNFANLLTSEIERIEVIRGPQSALWGSDALAGVINIISKRGQGALTVSGFSEGGSFGTTNSGGTLSGGGENYHFNVSGSYLKSSGSNISRQGNEDEGYENGTVSFNGGVTLFGGLSLELSGRHTDATNQFDDIDFFVTGLPMDTNNETETNQDYGKVQAKLTLFDGLWQHILAAAITSTDNDNFADGLAGSSTGGEKYKYDYQTNLFFDTSLFTAASHTLTLAVDYEKEDFTQRGQAGFFGDPNQDRDISTTGLVAEYRMVLWDQLSLSGSVRHDNNSDFANTTTYRATGAYTVKALGSRLHGSYGSGSKNPTFTERFGFFATSLTPFVGKAGLKPEKSHGWEIGIDQQILNERAQLGVTYFNEKLRDEINGFVFDGTLGAFTAANVNGASKRQGVEVAGELALLDNLHLSGSYTYVDATQPDVTGRQVREVRRPMHTASVNLGYRFFHDRAKLNLNINYTGPQQDDFFPPFPKPVQRVTLDDYTLVDLAGSYQVTEHISLYGRIENLLDDNYEDVFGFQTPGIAGFAGIRFTFQP